MDAKKNKNMKCYILSDKNRIPYSVNAFSAYTGFEQLGYETILIKSIDEIHNPDLEDIVFAGIGNIQNYLLNNFDIDTRQINFDYPSELNNYLGRIVYKSTLREVHSKIKDGVKSPFFIKPVDEQKLFTGVLINSFSDLPPILNNDTNVWVSEPIDLVSEFRCFVYYGKLIGVKNYKGNPFNMIDSKIVLNAIKDFTLQPKAFSLDFGLTRDGNTVLIEANDAHSLGSYGLVPFQYARLISARWAELTNTKDYLYYPFNINDFN